MNVGPQIFDPLTSVVFFPPYSKSGVHQLFG